MAKRKAKDPNAPKRGTKTLSNGATYDLDLGRIVSNPGGGSQAITSERASEFARLRKERKRQVVIDAANGAVERADFRAKYGSDAYIAAMIQAAMIKATSPEDPKMIDAARFVMQESGQAETIRDDTAGDAAQGVRVILSGLVSLAREIRLGVAAQAATIQTDNIDTTN